MIQNSEEELEVVYSGKCINCDGVGYHVSVLSFLLGKDKDKEYKMDCFVCGGTGILTIKGRKMPTEKK